MGSSSAETKRRSREIIQIVNKVFKQNVLNVASDAAYVVRYLQTGIAPIDHLLQGGLPYGRFVEVFGDYSTLKSYIGLKAIVQCQKEGGAAALIDTERAFDPDWAVSVGVDLDALMIWPPRDEDSNNKQPVNGERAIDVAETLIRGRVDLIVFDSVAATLPRAEEETQLAGDKNIQPARLASLMSLACRKLTAANTTTAVFWINQTRVNVGVMFGTNEAVPGGKALGFYSSMRLALRKSGNETVDEESYVVKDGSIIKQKLKKRVGTRIRATLEKSKLNVPHRDEYFVFNHQTGEVDSWMWLASKALELGVIYQQGGWWWKSENGARSNPKKQRLLDFRGSVDEEELLSLMSGRSQSPLVSPGSSRPAASKVGSPKRKSSKRVVRKSTQTQAQGESKTTGRTVKRYTK